MLHLNIRGEHFQDKIRLICLSNAAEFVGGAVIYAGRKLKSGEWSCTVLASKSKQCNELSAILLCTDWTGFSGKEGTCWFSRRDNLLYSFYITLELVQEYEHKTLSVCLQLSHDNFKDVWMNYWQDWSSNIPYWWKDWFGWFAHKETQIYCGICILEICMANRFTMDEIRHRRYASLGLWSTQSLKPIED